MSAIRAILPLTCSVILFALVMTGASAQKNLDLLTQSNLESLEEIKDLIRKVHLIFEKEVASKVREGSVPDGENRVDVDLNGCSCSGMKCSCCLYLRLWMFFLYGDCCVSMTVHPHNRSVLFTLSFKSWVLYNHEISVKNPPQICHHFPFDVKENVSENGNENGIGGCIHFYGTVFTSTYFKVCTKLLLQVLRVTMYTYDLGCFQLHFRNANQHQMSPSMEGGEVLLGRPGPNYIGRVLMGKRKHGV